MALGLGLKIGGALLGADMLGKLFGSDGDFTRAYMINRMTGQGGFFKTFFVDGFKSMFLGSRTASAMFGGMGGFPLGGSIYGGPMAYNPYMMNPMAMGHMPYSPMMFGRGLWPGY